MASEMALYPEMDGRAEFPMKNANKQAAKAAKKNKKLFYSLQWALSAKKDHPSTLPAC